MKTYLGQRGPGRTIHLWKVERYGRRLSMPTDDIAGRILADVFGPRLLQEDFRCYQTFKETMIAPRLDQGSWTLTEAEIRDWNESFRQQVGRPGRGSLASGRDGFPGPVDRIGRPPWQAGREPTPPRPAPHPGRPSTSEGADGGFPMPGRGPAIPAWDVGRLEAEDTDAMPGGGLASPAGQGAPAEPVAMVTWPSGVTRARVVQTTAHVVLLEGDRPVGTPPPTGTLLRLRLPGSREVTAARLAAYGKGGRFLVALGTRGVRGAARVRVDLPATIRSPHLYGAERVRVVDLSSSGARLSGLILPPGSDLELKLLPPGRRQAVSMRCVVIHTLEGDPPEMGVAFTAGSLSFSIELSRPPSPER